MEEKQKISKAEIYKHWKKTGNSYKQMAQLYGRSEAAIGRVITYMSKKKRDTRLQVDFELEAIAKLECQKGKDVKGTIEEYEINKKIRIHLDKIKALDPKFYEDISIDK